MATQTRVLASFDGGNCRFEYDFDDGTLRITAFRCVNNTNQSASGTLIRDSNGLIYETTFPPNQTTFINIPTGVAGRLQLVLDGKGRPTGVSGHLLWPA